jgi:hypothetical protein
VAVNDVGGVKKSWCGCCKQNKVGGRWSWKLRRIDGSRRSVGRIWQRNFHSRNRIHYDVCCTMTSPEIWRSSWHTRRKMRLRKGMLRFNSSLIKRSQW